MKNKFKLVEVEYNDGVMNYGILMPDSKTVMGMAIKKEEIKSLVTELNRVVFSIEDFSDIVKFIPKLISKASIE